MALLAKNKTTAVVPFPVGNGKFVSLPAAPAPGKEGEAFNLTGELKNLPNYTAQQALIDAGTVHLYWTDEIKYETPGLAVILGDVGPQGESGADSDEPSPGPDGVLGTDDDVYTPKAKFIVFDELEYETGGDRVEQVFESEVAPYRLRILQVFGAVSRGAKDAQMYLCCHPNGSHEPYSDKFDVSEPGRLVETSFVEDRIIEKDEELYVYCSTDYVLGNLTVVYQRLSEEA
jgi:hypothetical protein